MPQLSGSWQNNYSTKTRQTGRANEQYMYSLMSMAIMLCAVRLNIAIQTTIIPSEKWHYSQFNYTECHYAERPSGECRGAFCRPSIWAPRGPDCLQKKIFRGLHFRIF